jgi:hypothetical protein
MKALFATLCAAAVLALAAAPAHAQSFRELMEDIGLQKRTQHKMDFSERAPLVLPPSTDALPPPEEGGSLASVNPNWPNDPETAKALEDEEREKIPQHLRRKYREDAGRDIYEIQRKERESRASGEAATTPKAYDTSFDRNRVLTPEELKAAQKKQAEAPAQVYVEPERGRLTDPPPGYRSPSAAQPYGPGEKDKKKSGWLSKINPFN